MNNKFNLSFYEFNIEDNPDYSDEFFSAIDKQDFDGSYYNILFVLSKEETKQLYKRLGLFLKEKE